MKSKNNKTIVFKKHINLGVMPVFVSFMHRHLEKEQPIGIPAYTDQGPIREFTVPVDLLRLSVDNDELLRDISSVSFAYKERR